MKRFRIALFALMLVAVALVATGCNNSDVAAKVNGEVVTKAELDKQVEQLKVQYPQMFEGADGEGRLIDFKQRLLDNLINQKLIEQAAKDKGIEVKDADIDKQIEQLRSGFKDDAQFEQALKTAGMTQEQLTQQIRDQLITQKLIESLAAEQKVDPKEVKAYYDKNKSQFFQQSAKRASHILFKVDDEKTADKVLAQVEDGGDFAALAKQYSEDAATKAKGGDLGWPTTPYVPEFQAALDKLKKGQTSALVKTPYGWHIIRVTDERKGTQQKLSEVQDQIEQIVMQQRRADAYQKFLDELRAKAKIEIFIEELKVSQVPTGSVETTGK